MEMELVGGVRRVEENDCDGCGPGGVRQDLYDGMIGLGGRDERIHFESFGPATGLKHDAQPAAPALRGEVVDGPVGVSFAASDATAEWTPERGTLLDLAEAAGLSPAFACRSGICGTCATRIKCGAVDYVEEPIAPVGDDEVLICCATPRSAAGAETCGADQGVVLDLSHVCFRRGPADANRSRISARAFEIADLLRAAM